MKKSLALKLERSDKSLSKKKLSTRTPEGALKNAKTSLRIDMHSNSKVASGLPSAKANSFRNKNLTVITASLLNAFSELRTLDISHNKLTDSQIELVMNSCFKLEALSIQGNLTSIIPASIWKLKHLEKFRHDWVKLNPSLRYESEENLKTIKKVVRKPDCVVKVHNVVGMNFLTYCMEILGVPIDSSLQEKVKASSCSHFAQNEMMEAIRLSIRGKDTKDEEQIEISQQKKSSLPIGVGCFSICGFTPQETKPQEQKWREMPMKESERGRKVSQHHQQTGIKIENIRDISETQAGSEASTTLYDTPDISYQHKDMPLHLIFSRFDKNPNASVDIDRLLLKGYNPNTYDHNGLSAYHIVTIFRQEHGLERLIEISFKNPGFFDLEMPSLKEGRNILHFSVFLKDYLFTKKLIEFGFPIDKRDFGGARITHLVDQNYEFMLLLRKLVRRRYSGKAGPSFLSYPQPLQRKYTRHPPRVAQETNFQIVENKNLNLMQMYDAAVGLRSRKS